MRFLFIVLLASIATLTCNAQETDFEPYYCANGDFTILTSGFVSSETPASEAQPADMDYSYSFMADLLLYKAVYNPEVVSANYAGEESQFILDELARETYENDGGKIMESLQINYKDHPGRALFIEYANGNCIKSRIYLADGNMYLLQVISMNAEQMENPAAEMFLGSFKLGNTISPDTGVKDASLDIGELEYYAMATYKQVLDMTLGKKGWEYEGMKILEDFGAGYVYAFGGSGKFAQIYCFTTMQSVIYVPDATDIAAIESEIEKSYQLVEAEGEGIENQVVYAGEEFTVIIMKGTPELITLIKNK